MTIPNVSLGQTIDPVTFGNAVAAQLNGNEVQKDRKSYTTNASGVFQVTFAKAFTGIPIMEALVENASLTVPQTVTLFEVTSTYAQFILWGGSTRLNSTARVVHWKATGDIA